jgi:hypothetical protein
MKNATTQSEITEAIVARQFERQFGNQPPRQTHVAMEVRFTTDEAYVFEQFVLKLQTLIERQVIPTDAQIKQVLLIAIGKVAANLRDSAMPFEEEGGNS